MHSQVLRAAAVLTSTPVAWQVGTDHVRTSAIEYRHSADRAADLNWIRPSECSRVVVEQQVPATLPERWSSKLQRRFDELAEKEAMASLTDREADELRDLTVARRLLKHPRSTAEILAQQHRHITTQELLSVVSRYVRVHGSA